MLVIPGSIRRTVASATTRERLLNSHKTVPSILIQALSSNSGVIYIGDSEVSSTNALELTPATIMTLGAEDFGWADAKISLRDIWIDAATSGDGVQLFFLEGNDV